MAAGRAWARGELGSTRRSEAEEDARRWGLKRVPRRRREAEEDGVWRQHVAALRAFLAIAGQWRTEFVAAPRLQWVGSWCCRSTTAPHVTGSLWQESR